MASNIVLEKISTKRAKNNGLLVCGFVYNLKTTNKNGTKRYTCRVVGCGVGLTVSPEEDRIISVGGDPFNSASQIIASHKDHLPLTTIEQHSLRTVEQFKERSINEIRQPLEQLYDEERTKLITTVAKESEEVHRRRTSTKNERNSNNFPTISVSQELCL
jgi:hypothetical protein